MKYSNKAVPGGSRHAGGTPSPPSTGGSGRKGYTNVPSHQGVVDRQVVANDGQKQLTTVPNQADSQKASSEHHPRPNQLFICLITDGSSYELTERFEEQFLELGEAGGETVFFVNIGNPAFSDKFYEKLRSEALKARDESDRLDYEEKTKTRGAEKAYRLKEMKKLAGVHRVPDEARPCLVGFLMNPLRTIAVIPVDVSILDGASRKREFFKLVCDRVSEERIEQVIAESDIDAQETTDRLGEYLRRSLSVRADELIKLEVLEQEYKGGAVVKVNNVRVGLPARSFELFIQLVIARLNTDDGWVDGSDIVEGSFSQPVDRLRDYFVGAVENPKRLIQNDGSKRFCLASLPECITVPKEWLCRHQSVTIRELSEQLP